MKKVEILISLLLVTGCQMANNIEIPKSSPSIPVSNTPSIMTSTSTSVIVIPVVQNTISPTLTPVSVISSSPTPLTLKQIKKVEIFNKKNNLLIDSSETENKETNPSIMSNDYMDIRATVTYNDGTSTSDLLFKSSDETLAIVENDRISTVENKSGAINIIVLSKENNQEIFKSRDIRIGFCEAMECSFIEALTGIVYNDSGSPVRDAKVTVKNVYPGHEINDTTLTDEYGYYKIRYIPSGELIEVTVSKEGHKTVSRRVVLKYSDGKPINMINFGSSVIDEKAFALVPDRNN